MQAQAQRLGKITVHIVTAREAQKRRRFIQNSRLLCFARRMDASFVRSTPPPPEAPTPEPGPEPEPEPESAGPVRKQSRKCAAPQSRPRPRRSPPLTPTTPPPRLEPSPELDADTQPLPNVFALCAKTHPPLCMCTAQPNPSPPLTWSPPSTPVFDTEPQWPRLGTGADSPLPWADASPRDIDNPFGL